MTTRGADVGSNTAIALDLFKRADVTSEQTSSKPKTKVRLVVQESPHPQEPNILLVGGPGLPPDSAERIRFAQRLDAKIKLFLGNRYEHFEPTQRSAIVDGRELVVFEWSTSTRVAE